MILSNVFFELNESRDYSTPAGARRVRRCKFRQSRPRARLRPPPPLELVDSRVERFTAQGGTRSKYTCSPIERRTQSIGPATEGPSGPSGRHS